MEESMGIIEKDGQFYIKNEDGELELLTKEKLYDLILKSSAS